MDAYQVTQEARTALERETRIDMRQSPIAISVSDDAVVLDGEVASVAEKRLAAQSVATAKGHPRVVDRLRVRPTVRQGDGAVRDQVCSHLRQEPSYARISIVCQQQDPLARATRQSSDRTEGSIEVSVSDGVVTLRGQVPSVWHKQLAGVLAWRAPGCRDVGNQLQTPPVRDTDTALRQAIELMLRNSRGLRLDRVQADVSDGRVVLHGRVPTAEERRIAERDVWYIEGVRDVSSRIDVNTA